MALIACRECKKEVSNGAKICPHCGIQNPALTQNQTAAGGCLAVIIFMVLVAAGTYFYNEMQHQLNQSEIGRLQRSIEYNRSFNNR